MPGIAASFVFPVSSPPRRNAVVEIDDNGTILSVSQGAAVFRELAGVEYYSGILVPGLADLMCGNAESGHRLLASGVRVAGRIGKPPDRDGTWDIPGSPPAPRASWSNRYRRTIGYRFYENTEHFRKYFRESDIKGLCLFAGPHGDLQVLAGFGNADLLSLMLELQEGPGNYSLPELLTMATLNGALAAGYDHVAGTLSPGMRPGLNIIEGIDFERMRLLPGSRLRRL